VEISHCIALRITVVLKSAVCWSTLEQICKRGTDSLPPIITMLFLRRNFLFLFLIRLCSSGNQPLHNSAGWGNAAVCRLLIDARADIHAKGWG
jgi:hypothetical protein